MDHILLHTQDDERRSTLIGIDPSRFLIETGERPLDIVRFLIESDDRTPLYRLDSIAKEGRACGCGVIYPGALVFKALPTFLRPSADLEIFHDVRDSFFQVSGEEKIRFYERRSCQARLVLAEGSDTRQRHPLSDHFADKPDDWVIQEQVMAICLGVWDEVGEANPAVFSAKALTGLGAFLGIFRVINDEGRSFSNYVAVTASRAERMRALLYRQAAFVGDHPLNPTRLVTGPRFADFESMAASHSELRNLGRTLGRVLRQADETEILLASYLAYEETPGLSVPSDNAYRELDPENLTAHERMAAIALKADLLRAGEARVAA